MSANDWFAQRLADIAGLAVERPAVTETTAWGAAVLAGLGAGVFSDPREAARPAGRRFEPGGDPAPGRARWADAVARTLSRPARQRRGRARTIADDEILIAGGGIGGLTAALCLAAKGLRVRVFEAAPEFGEIGAGIQLSPNCNAGAAPARPGRRAGERSPSCPSSAQMRDWSSGETIVEAELGDGVRRRYGYPYYHIHRADLIGALAEAARRGAANRAAYRDAEVHGIEQSAGGVSLSAGGRRYRGRALIGADGIHSAVRAFLFGPEAPAFTGTVAWRGLVPTDRLPEGFVRPVSSNWLGPGGHVVHYYVRSGRLVNCVCVFEKEGWERESWTERGDIEELKAGLRRLA